MIEVEPPTIRIKRTELKARKDDHAHYRTIFCPGSFEERFFDPDHPKDSDWVSDIDYDRLFGRDKKVQVYRLQTRTGNRP